MITTYYFPYWRWHIISLPFLKHSPFPQINKHLVFLDNDEWSCSHIDMILFCNKEVHRWAYEKHGEMRGGWTSSGMDGWPKKSYVAIHIKGPRSPKAYILVLTCFRDGDVLLTNRWPTSCLCAVIQVESVAANWFQVPEVPFICIWVGDVHS